MKHCVIIYLCIVTNTSFFTNTHEQLALATQTDFLAKYPHKDDNQRCTQCAAKNDPMENTAQLVIEQIPVVFDSFIKIVQDPNNKETVPHHISTIVSSIVNIAVSTFKGKDQQKFKKDLQAQIERAVIEYIATIT